eukprot:scaffold11574_cov124-Isochrysis_galbana.AAC.1
MASAHAPGQAQRALNGHTAPQRAAAPASRPRLVPARPPCALQNDALESVPFDAPRRDECIRSLDVELARIGSRGVRTGCRSRLDHEQRLGRERMVEAKGRKHLASTPIVAVIEEHIDAGGVADVIHQPIPCFEHLVRIPIGAKMAHFRIGKQAALVQRVRFSTSGVQEAFKHTGALEATRHATDFIERDFLERPRPQ